MHRFTRTTVARLAYCLLGLTLAACQSTPAMPNISRIDFGEADDQAVSLYTLTNDNGMVAKITNYGAIVTELHAPDRDGNMADIVLGFDTLDEYIAGNPYFGCMAGRVANRIALGRFTLDGVDYQLATNNDSNHLHGGVKGFDKVVWKAKPSETEDGPALALAYLSPDGDENYPGNMAVSVIYTLTHDNELRIEISATADKATPVNIVHHTYWNLAGHDSGDILGDVLTLNADRYTPTDATLIPTGDITPVAGTPFDFSSPKAIGADIRDLPGYDTDAAGGYDLNYVLNDRSHNLHLAARASDPGSGRMMEIFTTEPGIQFYSGNFLDGVAGKGGAVYEKHAAFCLETQHYPDSINNEGRAGWPSTVIRPGDNYHHVMVHRFSTD